MCDISCILSACLADDSHEMSGPFSLKKKKQIHIQAADKALISTEKHLYFSYLSINTYMVGRHF